MCHVSSSAAVMLPCSCCLCRRMRRRRQQGVVMVGKRMVTARMAARSSRAQQGARVWRYPRACARCVCARRRVNMVVVVRVWEQFRTSSPNAAKCRAQSAGCHLRLVHTCSAETLCTPFLHQPYATPRDAFPAAAVRVGCDRWAGGRCWTPSTGTGWPARWRSAATCAAAGRAARSGARAA